MSKPIKLPANYGKIPKGTKPTIKCKVDTDFLVTVREQECKCLPGNAGSFTYTNIRGTPWKFNVIPIKQGDEVKGWLISDLKREKHNQAVPAEANTMILKNEENPKFKAFCPALFRLTKAKRIQTVSSALFI